MNDWFYTANRPPEQETLEWCHKVWTGYYNNISNDMLHNGQYDDILYDVSEYLDRYGKEMG